jgi:thiamine pyrophosphate-dependent acetolactate synthase large subunit-like protein
MTKSGAGGAHARTGAAMVVRALRQAGVEAIFGIPGAHLLPFLADAERSELRCVVTRHEQAAGFMADGYARAGDRIGVCFVSESPGALNVMTPLAAAQRDGVPLVALVGRTRSGDIGRSVGHAHELTTLSAALSAVSGWWKRSTRVEDVFDSTRAALHHAREKSGVAVLELPLDVQTSIVEQVGRARCTAEGADGSPRPPRQAQAWRDRIAEAADVLGSCRRIVICVGSRVHGGMVQALVDLAHHLRAGVVITPAGPGRYPADDIACIGPVMGTTAVRRYLEACDGLIAVGTSFNRQHFPEGLLLPSAKIRLLEKWELDESAAAIDLIGPIDEIAGALQKSVPAKSAGGGAAEWCMVRAEVEVELREHSEQAMMLADTIHSSLPQETHVVSDITVLSYWMAMRSRAASPEDHIYPYELAPLGYALPAAIGAKIARPERTVIALVGDGGFLYTGYELATAARSQAPVVILLLNDGRFGLIAERQHARAMSTASSMLLNPDFCALARSFGAAARRLGEVQDLRQAIEEATARDQTTLLELPFTLKPPPGYV